MSGNEALHTIINTYIQKHTYLHILTSLSFLFSARFGDMNNGIEIVLLLPSDFDFSDQVDKCE